MKKSAPVRKTVFTCSLSHTHADHRVVLTPIYRLIISFGRKKISECLHKQICLTRHHDRITLSPWKINPDKKKSWRSGCSNRWRVRRSRRVSSSRVKYLRFIMLCTYSEMNTDLFSTLSTKRATQRWVFSEKVDSRDKAKNSSLVNSDPIRTYSSFVLATLQSRHLRVFGVALHPASWQRTRGSLPTPGHPAFHTSTSQTVSSAGSHKLTSWARGRKIPTLGRRVMCGRTD